MEVRRQLCYLSEAVHRRQPRVQGQCQRLRVLPQVVGQALQHRTTPLLVLLMLLLTRLLIRVQRYLVEKIEELVAQGDDE